MEEREKVRLLSVVNLLESLSWEEVEKLSRRLPEMRLNGGQVLFTPAYQGRVIFLLLRGLVRLYRVAEGREITLGVVGTGGMFGEAALTLGKQARLLDLAHDAILVRDMNGTITFWNRGAEDTYGWSRDETVGKNCLSLLKKQFPEPLEEIEAELLREDTGKVNSYTPSATARWPW